MRNFWNFLTETRTLTVLGFIAIAAFLFLGASTLKVGAIWAGMIMLILFIIWLIVWLVRRRRARKAANEIGGVLEQQAEKAVKSAAPERRAEVEALRVRMLEAVKTIKTSKLGQVSGRAALYEMPWYMVIGNPAAGKSTAVVNSGLTFPFADKTDSIIQGIGGTRNCDWFFTTEGILLDTAGRYSVHDEDREEWMGFLDLLKKHRPKAPVNGVIVTVSVSELYSNRPEFAINLAKNLRQRVQELTERLEIFAPVYILFTKADLIAGFTEFFRDGDKAERDRVWGATLPFDPAGKGSAIAAFDVRFDELYEGLKESSIAQMSMSRGARMPPGVLTFPLEFASIKSSLRSFLATFFEDNPFQFKPVFRGFYFTSALQEGASLSASTDRVAQRFSLQNQRGTNAPSDNIQVSSKNGFFLRDLFSKVIFADRNLVRQYSSRTKTRLRYISFFAGVGLLGLILGGWSWSYIGNRQLVTNVQADLDKIVKIQDGKLDLQSRMESLEILQDRLEQLEKFKDSKPLSISLGLYQGDELADKLRAEYYSGLKDVLLKPVAGGLEAYLTEVNLHPDRLQAMTKPPEGSGTRIEAVAPKKTGPQQYRDTSPASAEDAYNALKTYLMLGDKQRVEAGHLTDQVTRYWRTWLEANRGNMPREQMIRKAERIISTYLARVNDDNWPLIENNITLVDQSRENLQRVVRGMPARERVYSEIKSRASTRFASMTVARIVGEENTNIVAGSQIIPGTFTREAWEKYVEPAIKDAANKELQSSDWVLKTAATDDLTLEGSPEQIQKALVSMYKTEYAKEWQRFVQGITVAEFASFEQAVTSMNRLGDPQNSPINKVINTLYDQTSWDNPSMLNEGLKNAQRGFVDWFRQTILRQAPSQVNVNVNIGGTKSEIPVGPIGKEFAGVARLIVTKDRDASLLRGYMDTLSKVRTRFNQIKNQGDPGPGARQFMMQTLEGNSSELSDALKYVDEQMLTGMTDAQRQSLRPLLVRPLVQAFAVMIKPAELEVNKTWSAQVYEPFQKTLAGKYPFTTESRIEATSGEVNQVFGSDGSIAKFVTTTMGPLVVRRGDTLAPRTWADVGLNLTPEFTANFAKWIAPVAGGPAAGAAAPGAASDPQKVFQIQPLPVSGVTEYTVEIDGQVLRYRNTPAQWTNFTWPGQGTPGAKVSAVAFDGRTIEIVNFPGRSGLEKLIDSAQRTKKDNGVFEMAWSNAGVNVAVDLRIISSAQTAVAAGATAGAPQGSSLRGIRLPSSVVGSEAVPQAIRPAVAPAGREVNADAAGQVR
jgi:type VI secretion system protein ImpL